MEEWAADRKIRASRLMKRYPELKRLLESGKLNLSLLELVQGYVHREKLNDSEFAELIAVVSGLSKRAATKVLASRYPESIELPRDQIRPIGQKHSEVRFVADESLLEKIEEVRGLLAHSRPKATLAEILDHLATDYLRRNHPEEKARRAQEREAKKEALSTPRVESEPPSPAPARVPSHAIIHKLTRQEGYSCSYINPLTGKRCSSRHGLQIDHIQAWSKGGKTELKNLRYLCQGHHQRVSFVEFGESSKYFGPKLP
jgi:hypothetical protein